MREVDVASLDINPFTSIGDDWMLVTAGDVSNPNTMTASWGGLGVLWGAPAATCYIRQSRYTKQFVDKNELFTLSFFDRSYHKQLAYLGAKSGRDENKIEAVGFTPLAVDGTTTFEQAKLTLVCRKELKLYLGPDSFIDQGAKLKWYNGDDSQNYHTMYIGKIEHAYLAE